MTTQGRINLERLNEVFPNKDGLSPKDVAKYLGINEKTVRRAIPFVKIGGRQIITKATLAELVAGRSSR